ncbi:kinase-like protein [Gymnopus androsaceus JB14]|uniref:mitogen-activated protein kinase n=1 Tax=Gymnopus androsaceus JB14 TaxID=1447944 RepID=A0A6A4I6L7_9AGAR|nr:kinase-like protein [Gymnopus androsaceus JB14]
MPDTTQTQTDSKAAAATKTKHSHAASQRSLLPEKFASTSHPIPSFRRRRRRCLWNRLLCGHRPSGRKVAIKKIAPFDHSMFCLRTLRELKLLKFLSEAGVSENIISVLDIIKPPSLEAFKEFIELMETDMHRVIRTQDLSDDHAQYFIYQTLRALKALHSADVIHRDLKPSNLLLNANCDLKPSPSGTETGFMTEYVATRWYRAPEIMLTFKQYTKAIDVWSVGCILAEMLSGKPLFPGRDYHHQLTLILDVLGTPTLDEFYAITTRRSRDYIRALPFRKKRPFSQIFPNATPLAVDFLTKTLTFDPKKRITVEDALAHPYLEAYHDPETNLSHPHLIPSSSSSIVLHKDDISREQLKELLYEEIMTFTPAIMHDARRRLLYPVSSVSHQNKPPMSSTITMQKILHSPPTLRSTRYIPYLPKFFLPMNGT